MSQVALELKNINRYMESKEFLSYKKLFSKNNSDDGFGNVKISL